MDNIIFTKTDNNSYDLLSLEIQVKKDVVIIYDTTSGVDSVTHHKEQLIKELRQLADELEK